MDANRFDSLIRNLPRAPSRRVVLAALASGLLAALPFAIGGDEIEASKKNRNRKRRKTTCKGGKRKCGKQCIPSTSCCGDGDCANGAECLPNRSCARICSTDAQCGSGCICSLLTVETFAHCIVGNLTTCDQFPQQCASTVQCPQGQHCQGTGCGPGGANEYRCVPLCTA